MTSDKSKNPKARGHFDIESSMAIELRRIMLRIGRRIDLEREVTLLVTSAQRGEGKSLFTLHFALILAYHLSAKVLLVDGDTRRPVQHTVFDCEVDPGFANLLTGKTTITEAVVKTKVKNLDFLPAGRPGKHPSRLFGGNRVRYLMDELHKTYDIILLDSPPVVPVSDALHYLEGVDGVLYLVMVGQTHKEISRRGMEILRNAGGNVLGAVANNLGEVLPYYYDHKYYGYESDE